MRHECGMMRHRVICEHLILCGRAKLKQTLIPPTQRSQPAGDSRSPAQRIDSARFSCSIAFAKKAAPADPRTRASPYNRLTFHETLPVQRVKAQKWRIDEPLM